MAVVAVKVVPNASADRVAGRYGEAIKLAVAAPAEDGKANRAVLRLLADVLGVKPFRLQIIKGQYQPRKLVKVEGMEQAEVDARVNAIT